MIGIVTVQWNSSDITRKFLENISTQLSESVTLVIVDNGSSTEHLIRLKEKITENFTEHKQNNNTCITLIENQHNSGFARANNVGINYFKQLHKSWIWLLNNDCSLTANTIDDLTNRLPNYSACLLGTKILDNNNKLETYGGYVFNKWTSQYQPVKQIDLIRFRSNLFYLSGASMLVHRELFEKCGLLDESTFLYFEEMDFCLRAKEAGYKIDILPEIIVSHLGSGSSNTIKLKNTKTYHETWSTLYFYSKHQKSLFPFAIILRTFIKLIMLIVKSRRSEMKSVLSATTDFIMARNKDLASVKITKITHYG